MKCITIRDDYVFLNESSEITLSKDQEKDLINQFLDYINNKEEKDFVESSLVNILYSLNAKDILNIKVVDRDIKSDLSSAYGYYSAYENKIYLVVDKSNFNTKWFGLKTDYNNFYKNDLSKFVKTMIHELMHYACSNYYNDYIKIWNSTFKQFIYDVLSNVLRFYFSDFVSTEVFKTISSDAFIKDPNFKRAFDTYYNSLLINIRFRYKSLIKRYNDVLSTLYSKHSFEYARFFDNILINAIKLQSGDFSDVPLKLYRCINKAYIDLESNFSNIKMSELFYQELLDFSEISCVLANYYKYTTKYSKMILDTLELI